MNSIRVILNLEGEDMHQQHYLAETSAVDQWLSLNDFVSEHSQFTENQLRWLIRHKRENGLNSVFKKVGKRIYINEQGFADWLTFHEGGRS